MTRRRYAAHLLGFGALIVFGVAALAGATIFLVTHTDNPLNRPAATAPRSPDPIVAEARGDTCDAGATMAAGECDAGDAAIAAEPDPYGDYLAHNPDPQLVLSPEDAQARAYLGCGKSWARGTIDRVLADAYRPTGICD